MVIEGIAIATAAAIGSVSECAVVTGEASVGGGSLPAYDGPYAATPSQVAQTFATGGKTMRENFVVQPIPSNYGLITHNGYELTVS